MFVNRKKDGSKRGKKKGGRRRNKTDKCRHPKKGYGVLDE
jgi:hypothetical protein